MGKEGTMGEPRILTFEDIIAAEDIRVQTVDVPEWGGAVRIRTFTKETELAMRAKARGLDGSVDAEKLEMLMLVYGIVEPELTYEQIPHLRTKNAGAVDRVLTAIVNLNRMGGEAIAEAAAEFQTTTGEGADSQVGA